MTTISFRAFGKTRTAQQVGTYGKKVKHPVVLYRYPSRDEMELLAVKPDGYASRLAASHIATLKVCDDLDPAMSEQVSTMHRQERNDLVSRLQSELETWTANAKQYFDLEQDIDKDIFDDNVKWYENRCANLRKRLATLGH